MTAKTMEDILHNNGWIKIVKGSTGKASYLIPKPYERFLANKGLSLDEAINVDRILSNVIGRESS